ncbi:MAG TPA: hypothetical protein VIV11_14890 [Kofleriaceae bacterium]
MRSSALFTVIVVAAAGTATAEPKQEETSGRVSLNEKDVKKTEPRQPSDWVELATPTPAKHGTEFIIVGKDAGYFTKIRIDPAKGRTVVRRVKVFFEDGKVKTTWLDKAVSQGRAPIVVELGNAKIIDRIVVTTETHTNGQYAIYGSSGGGVVGSR